MNLTELINEVYVLTGRSDLVAQTKSAVKAATLKAHKSDYYSKDIVETGVQFNAPSYTQCLDYSCVVHNFRSLKYLRRVEGAADDNGTFFEIVTPDNILDSYNQNRTDIAYVAGNVLQIRASVTFSKALMGAYVLPTVTDTGYSSWVATNNPFAIIYEACRVIFKTIGFDEQSATFNSLVLEEYNLLKMSGLTDLGY
jgi:hypothetical protein|tara:strand:- start:1429 stop:2019 length:591 start_codon:yes stop_codon:yes gene_type:complete